MRPDQILWDLPDNGKGCEYRISHILTHLTEPTGWCIPHTSGSAPSLLLLPFITDSTELSGLEAQARLPTQLLPSPTLSASLISPEPLRRGTNLGLKGTRLILIGCCRKKQNEGTQCLLPPLSLGLRAVVNRATGELLWDTRIHTPRVSLTLPDLPSHSMNSLPLTIRENLRN